MSFCCHITVQFEVSRVEKLASWAQHWRERLADRYGTDWPSDAERFLEYAAEGKGVGHGPKGAVFTWGNVGNYTDLESVVTVLQPFWDTLFAQGVVSSHDSIIVMCQPESPEDTMEMAEIRVSSPSAFGGKLVVAYSKSCFPLFHRFLPGNVPFKPLKPDGEAYD